MLYPEDSQEWTPWLPVTPAGPHWLWLHPGRAWSRGHAGRPWPLLMASRRLSVLACTDTLKLLGPCYFAYSCASPLPLRWLGPEPISSWSLQAKQEHFPPNSFVLEDKRTEGLYKAQKQMSFTVYNFHPQFAGPFGCHRWSDLTPCFVLFFKPSGILFLACPLEIYFLEKCLVELWYW